MEANNDPNIYRDWHNACCLHLASNHFNPSPTKNYLPGKPHFFVLQN
jgi:hypothetical protein